ncbi:PREDICTED: putative high mobility group B protein 11 [Camelina sativa]|uniref:High mobility group B protein 11 n=1 Tax=Camelina sativa TaxID=90675 RepID=A0ABM0T6X8_CAMSA|nr:PREDICTED: putative high mobility group B protein 11 [Camelina sativa]
MSIGKSQIEVVPANGFSALEKGDSSRTSMYEDLVQNPKLFWDTLRDFLESSGQHFKIPLMDGTSLDLHRLFIEVTLRGGLQEVIKNRRCTEVIGLFNFKTVVTNAASVLRANYERTLLEFEHVYFFRAPRATFKGIEKAPKRPVRRSTKRGMEPQELKPGAKVTGIIDGKFESGYLVTVKKGSVVFKGVLSPIPQAAPRTRRRMNKRAKLHPKASMNSCAAETVAETHAAQTVAKTNAEKTVAETHSAESVAETNAEEGVPEIDAAETVAAVDAAETVAAVDAAEL